MTDHTDLAATQAFYGRWARLYDVLATAPGVRSWRAATADALALSPGDTVVEMGCGTGANVPHLRERVGASGRIVCLDLTRGMLDRASERVEAAGWDNVHLVRGDARQAPVAGPVDAVLGTFVVGMFPESDAVVADWLDLLADDGSLALLNATRSPRPLAKPLNLAFETFVRLSSPGGGSADDGSEGGDGEDDGSEVEDDGAGTGDAGSRRSPTDALEHRIARASATLAEGTATSGDRRLAGGFVSLRWGRRPV